MDYFKDKNINLGTRTVSAPRLFQPLATGASAPDTTCKACGYVEHAKSCPTLGCPVAREAGLPPGWMEFNKQLHSQGSVSRPGFAKCPSDGGQPTVALLRHVSDKDYRVAVLVGATWYWADETSSRPELKNIGTLPPADLARKVDAALAAAPK